LQNRATEFWVGLFTLFGIGLALYMVYRTGDLRWKREPGYEVYANFNNVSGLDVGDTVRVAGVDVGKVGNIKLKGALGRVTFIINHRVSLYEDATAEVKTMGLLGNQYISIAPGHSKLPRVSPGGEIHAAVSHDNINVVMGKLSEVAGDIKSVTENMKRVFGGEEGEDALREIVQNTQDLSRQLVQITRENQHQFKEITTHLAGLTGEIHAMVSDNREAIQRTVASLPETAENLRGITGETRKLLEAHHEDLSVMLQQLRVASLRLETSLNNLENISQQIKDGEGTLGKLIYDPALYEEAKSTMQEARNLIEDMREQAPISAFIALGGAIF